MKSYLCLLLSINIIGAADHFDSHPILKKTLTNTAIGTAAGSATMLVNAPLNYCKNVLQLSKTKQRVPTAKPQPTLRELLRNPLHCYRGVGMGIANLAPTTAVQVAAFHAFKDAGVDEIVAASIGGLLSASINAPASFLTLQQQQHGQSAYFHLNSTVKKYGVRRLWRGFGATAAREFVYAPGYLIFSPKCQNFIRSKTNNEFVAAVGGNAFAGATASVVSHVPDTLKTMFQDDVEKKEYNSYRDAIRKTKKQKEGLKQLWAGLGLRTARVIVSITALSTAHTLLKKYSEQHA